MSGHHLPRCLTLLLLTSALGVLGAPSAHAAADTPSGGSSFDSAPRLLAGDTKMENLRQTLVTGDALYWTVPAKPGQFLTVRPEVTLPKGYPTGKKATLDVRLYTAEHEDVSCVDNSDSVSLHEADSSVRTLNASCRTAPLEESGDYYVRIAINDPAKMAEGTDIPLSVQFSRSGTARPPEDSDSPSTAPPDAAVPNGDAKPRSGPAQGRSQQTQPAPPSRQAPSQQASSQHGASQREQDSSGGSVLWPVLVVLLLLSLGYAAFRVLRRRARPAGPAVPPKPTSRPAARATPPPAPPPADPKGEDRD